MGGVARCRPEHDVKLLPWSHPRCFPCNYWFEPCSYARVWENDRVEVCGRPGILHDSEVCRLHGQRKSDWRRGVPSTEYCVRCQPPVRWPGWWSVCLPSVLCSFYGQRTSDWRCTTYCREHRVWRQPKFAFLEDGVEIIANDQGNRMTLSYVAFTKTYRVWSGKYLLFLKSEQDLTVDLCNCVIDVSSRWDSRHSLAVFHESRYADFPFIMHCGRHADLHCILQ